MNKKNEIKAGSFREYLNKTLKKPKYKKAYEQEKLKVFLGYQISCLRESAGLTQAELARLIGTRQSNVSRLETGNLNFTVEMLEKIAEALRAELTVKFIPHKTSRAA